VYYVDEIKGYGMGRAKERMECVQCVRLGFVHEEDRVEGTGVHGTGGGGGGLYLLDAA
jgi:hypothetical protein